MKITAFWDMAPCRLEEVDEYFRGAYCLHYQGALMMEAALPSETSIFNETTRRHILEGNHLHTLCRENPKYHRGLVSSK
jgi:hypothetical protein